MPTGDSAEPVVANVVVAEIYSTDSGNNYNRTHHPYNKKIDWVTDAMENNGIKDDLFESAI